MKIEIDTYWDILVNDGCDNLGIDITYGNEKL